MNTDIAVLTLLAWLAFVLSRTLQRRKVPELVGFIVAGIIVGPSVLGLLDDDDLTRIRPLTEFALATLMFLVGERLSLRAFRGARWIVVSGLLSYVLSAGAVGTMAWSLGADSTTILVLAVLAGAAAPMTMASIATSSRARGSVVSGLIGSHAVSDALAAAAFAVAIPAAAVLQGTGTMDEAVRQSLRLGVGAVVVGVVFGLVVVKLAHRVESSGEVLVLALVHLLVAATLASAVGVSLPLAALVMGATVAGTRNIDVAQRLFSTLRAIEQPLYLVFFTLAGVSIHLDEVAALGAVGLGYVVARTLGKVAGGFLGGLFGGFRPGASLRIGFDLLPQAGVAVGLAVLATEILGDDGRAGAAVVLGSVVLFELVGPLVVARSFPHLPVEEKGVVDERMPDAVLLATMSELDVPAWILDWCTRTGAELTVLAPGPGREGGEDEAVDLLRRRCSEEGIPLHWRMLSEEEEFTSEVARAAAEIGADLVAVVVPSIDQPELWLRSGPVERLPARLEGPVVLLPAVRARAESGAAAPAPAATS